MDNRYFYWTDKEFWAQLSDLLKGGRKGPWIRALTDYDLVLLVTRLNRMNKAKNGGLEGAAAYLEMFFFEVLRRSLLLAGVKYKETTPAQRELIVGEFLKPYTVLEGEPQVLPELPDTARMVRRRYPRPYELIPSNLLYQFAQRAVARAPEGAFVADGDFPTYAEKRRGFDASMEIRPNNDLPLTLQNDPEAILRSMNDKLVSLGDMAVDVMDIVFARYVQNRHRQESVVVTTDEILLARGLKPKTKSGYSAGYRPEEKKAVLSIMGALDNLWIVVGEMTVHERGKKRPRTFRERSRLMMVTGLAEQVTVDGDTYPVAWRVLLGDVFTALLSSDAAPQFALLSTKTLNYDPYRQKWEKRLSRYFHPLWRIRRRAGSYLDAVRVRTVFEAIGQEIDSRNPHRTRDRFEQAMDTLASDGIIESWHYDGAEESDLGARGWVKRWLDWKVVVAPAQALMERYALPVPVPRAERKGELSLLTLLKIEENGDEEAPTAQDAQTDAGAFRGARERLGMTQFELAGALGVSRSLVAQIESGRRRATPELTKALKGVAAGRGQDRREKE